MLATRIAKAESHRPGNAAKAVKFSGRACDQSDAESERSPARDEQTRAHVAWSLSKISILPRGTETNPGADPVLPQRKLAVGEKDDPLEREADRIAEKVTQPGRGDSGRIHLAAPVSVQRECACGGSCESCKAWRNHDEEEHKLLRKPAAGPEPVVAPHSVHATLRSGGEPLDAASRAFFEPRFGRDFGHVRVHTDSLAADSAAAVNARAYASGHHIVFAAGQYGGVQTQASTRLLAHELTHVMQQSERPLGRIQRDTKNDPPTMKQAPGPKQPTPLEARWADVKRVAGGFAELKGWITAGDEVIDLIAQHDDLYRHAFHERDAEMVIRYQQISEFDLVEYNYVAWHAFVYQNLLRIRGSIDSLATSFKKDQRHFTGRAEAEEKVNRLQEVVDNIKILSNAKLEGVGTHFNFKYQKKDGTVVPIRVSDSANAERRKKLQDATTEVKFLQLEVQDDLKAINKFTTRATIEGAKQAAEAVKEYIEVRRGILDDSTDPDAHDSNDSGSGSGGDQKQLGSGSGGGGEQKKLGDGSGSGGDHKPHQDSGGGLGSGSGTGAGSGSGGGSGVGSGSGSGSGAEKKEEPKKEEPKKPVEKCATAAPDKVPCTVLSSEYNAVASNCFSAIARGKARLQAQYPKMSITTGNQDLSDRGPCTGKGGIHSNVMRNGSYIGAIVCCPCCEDMVSGPNQQCRCGFVRKMPDGSRKLQPFP